VGSTPTNFANETFDPVPDHRVTHLTTHCYTEAETAIVSPAVEEKKVRLIHLLSVMGKTKKFGPFPDSQRGRKTETGRHRLLGGNLDRQTFTSLGATTLDDKTTVFRGHPNKETMGSFSADIAGLKGSFHGYVASPGE
jgi:hypothetical protein